MEKRDVPIVDSLMDEMVSALRSPSNGRAVARPHESSRKATSTGVFVGERHVSRITWPAPAGRVRLFKNRSGTLIARFRISCRTFGALEYGSSCRSTPRKLAAGFLIPIGDLAASENPLQSFIGSRHDSRCPLLSPPARLLPALAAALSRLRIRPGRWGFPG